MWISEDASHWSHWEEHLELRQLSPEELAPTVCFTALSSATAHTVANEGGAIAAGVENQDSPPAR